MSTIRSSEITDKTVCLRRREFMAAALGAAGAALVAPGLRAQEPAAHGRKLATVSSPVSTSEAPNSWEHVTTYNNFYEFGTNKDDPARNAPRWRLRQPWMVSIEGECAKTGRLTLEDILKGETLEDRIYRMRCVEGWSMVIPWVGFPLANLVRKCEPTAKARFVEFTTLHDTGQMPGQRSDVLEWPYVEGLRLDEALHPPAAKAASDSENCIGDFVNRCSVCNRNAVASRLLGEGIVRSRRSAAIGIGGCVSLNASGTIAWPDAYPTGRYFDWPNAVKTNVSSARSIS